jgi:flagellar L-ring protein precursor FlgH
MNRKQLTIILLAATALSVTGCANTLRKMSQIGDPPPETKVENPQLKADYKPLTWPLPDPEGAVTHTANSLWQPGARGFFRDQRATRVGDILRVNVSITDTAQFDNTNNLERTSQDNSTATGLFGLESKLGKLLPIPGVSPNPANLINTTGNTKTDSTGRINRRETVTTQIAALVTQQLPNGNLVIQGSQEVLVNYEIREVSIKGVIRPQDILSDNSINSNQVAEARIIYSGRGQMSEITQPRWGSQAVEILSPF